MVKSFANGDKIYHVELNNMVDAHNENGVLVGLEVSAQGTPSLTLDIDTGQCYINNETYVESSITTVVIGTGVGLSNPRIDIVCYNPAANAAVVIAGIPAVAAQPPNIPTNNILLALIHVSVDCTVIESNQIIDERIFVKPVGILYIPSDTLLQSDDAEYSHMVPSYVKVKEIVVPDIVFGNDSELRIRYDLKSGESSECVYGRVYRNGSQVSSTQNNCTATYITFPEDINGWAAGDLIQLYTSAQSTSREVFVRNFRVYGDIEAESVYNW